MTDTDQTVEHRRTWTADPEAVRVEDAGEGLFSIRMPLASTAEARDGRALERERIEGWREQIAAEPLPLFLDHGNDGLSRHRYGALSKVGYWTDPELVERDDGVDLEAAAVVADPAELDDDVGGIREALAWLRTQAELGIPIASSAGWSEDTGSRDVPGGYDLMEGSIVGIPSDERTTTASASADPVALARAVNAASEEFDGEAFLRELNGNRDESMSDDDTPADDAGDETEENREEKDKYDRLAERVDELHEKNDRELEILREMNGDGDDGEGEDDEDDADDENADEPDEQSEADTDDTAGRSVTIDGEEVDPDEALERLRDAASDAEPADSETRNVGDDADTEAEETETDEQRDDEPDTNDDETPSFSFS